MTIRRMLTLTSVLIATVGCVTRGRYDAAVRDAEQAKLAAAEVNEQAMERLKAMSTEIARLSSALSERENALQQREQQVSDGRVSTHNLQARLD
jgi:chromosome segregation ATPase